MKALVIKQPHVIECSDVPEPRAGREEVLIKVKAAGICGTDMHIFHGKHGAVTYPRIAGHELVGEVISIGDGVDNVKVGNHVAVDPVVSCGQCPMCKRGRDNICHQVKCLGVQTEGGFAEYIAIHKDRIYPFSSEVPWEVAVLVEPFSVAAQIAARLRIESTDKVLIVGGGTIGLALMQVVQGVYNGEAVIADITQQKLNLARDMGAKSVIDANEGDIVSQAMEIWNNFGPTVIIEAVGNSALLNSLINTAPPGSRIGVIGFMSDPINILPVDITKRELEIIGSRMNEKKFALVLKWFEEGKVDGRKLITHKFMFSQVQEAFYTIEKFPEEVCKVILEF
ncbi:MAG: alcohol dehydrogenase catalytic domain-containing protein [Bacillota bacterium]